MPRDRASLARDLQLELRRVGCYGGELNGVWTPASRKAMKAFTDRVNATLPVEEPDDILLALVQAHQGEACGKPCPAGQGLSEDGRCLPGAILAQAAKKGSAARRNGGTTDGGPAGREARTGDRRLGRRRRPLPLPAPYPVRALVGRMALAGPKIDAPPPAAEAPPGPAAPGGPRAPSRRPDAAARAAGQGARARRSGTCRRAYGRRSGFVEVGAVQPAFDVLTASAAFSSHRVRPPVPWPSRCSTHWARMSLSSRRVRSRSARFVCRSSIAASMRVEQHLRLGDLRRIGVVERQILGDLLEAEAQVLAAQDQHEPRPVAARVGAGDAPARRRDQPLGLVEADGPGGHGELVGQLADGVEALGLLARREGGGLGPRRCGGLALICPWLSGAAPPRP